jgi:hypothetical protein
MDKKRSWLLLLMGGVLALMLGLIGSVALAQTATPEAETPTQEETTPEWGSRFRGFGRFGGNGNWLENLAEALGITVDELEDAQQQAYAASVADAVAAGQITQEQADQILARHALKSYIDRQAILAAALGMSVDDLEAALADDQSIVDLMVERGIDSATLQTNARAAYETAVRQAVADGVITQAQADEILAGDGFNLFGRGGFGGHRGGHHGGRGGFHGFVEPSSPDDDGADTTDTGFDA